jgi:hypothetical protein
MNLATLSTVIRSHNMNTTSKLVRAPAYIADQLTRELEELGEHQTAAKYRTSRSSVIKCAARMPVREGTLMSIMARFEPLP